MGPVAKRMGLSSHLCRAFLLPLGAAIIMASCSAANPVSALKTCQTHEMSAEFRMGHNSRNLPAFGFAPTFTKALSGSSIEKAASPVRAMRSRPLGGLRAQLPNPFATFFGNEQTKDRQYHESRHRPLLPLPLLMLPIILFVIRKVEQAKRLDRERHHVSFQHGLRERRAILAAYALEWCEADVKLNRRAAFSRLFAG